MKPKMFVFMGGQGSGKGTFAHLLMKKHNFNYIETGAILRQMPEDSPFKQKIARGELVGDSDLFPIISNNITENQDIILDGFPRTIGQAKWLVENYADIFDINIVFLNISESKMLAHIQKRINEGGNRADDSDETAVRKRLESFKNMTMPAIDWLNSVSSVKFHDLKLPSDDIDINFEYIYTNLYK